MRSGHALIIGRTGSGKTVLARALARRAARIIVLDSEYEYDLPDAVYVYDYDTAATQFLALRHRSFRIVARMQDHIEMMGLVELAIYAQQHEAHGPLVILLEEASQYGDTYDISPQLRALYNRGRHWRISLLTVIQVDTDLHRVARYNARWIVCCAHNKLSSDMARLFDLNKVEQLRPVSPEDFANNPEFEPIQGTHFLVYPDVDLYSEYEREHGYIVS